MTSGSSQPSVLFVVNSLARGGMERMAVALTREMQRRGRFRPVVACLDAPGELADRVLAAGIDLHIALLHHKFDWKVIRRLRRIFAGDIAVAKGGAGGPLRRPISAAVIVNPGGDRMFWTSLSRGRRRPGRPGYPALVLWTHSTPQPGRRLIEPLNRPFIPRLDAIAVLGPRQAHSYARIEGLPPGRMHHVPNGLPIEHVARLADRSARADVRAELGASADHTVVMCVANLRPVKRVDLFCEAAARLLAGPAPALSGWRFWLVGDGPGRGQLARLTGRLNLRRPRFVWTGSRADTDRLWPAADIGVCCSDSEGLSVAMLESMSAGAAFVSTAVGEHPTVIEPERTGLLVAPGSAEALAGAIARLGDDASLRQRLARAAAERVRERYTADRMADAFEAMLLSVTRPGRSRGDGCRER